MAVKKKRRCKGKTKAGKRCKAAPLKGKDHCSAHDPLAPAETRFGSPEQAAVAGALGGAAGRVPRVREEMQRQIEQHLHRLVRPYLLALGVQVDDEGNFISYDIGAIVVGKDKEGGVYPSEVLDLGAQIAAAEALTNRVEGRPVNTTELTGVGGGPIELEADLSDPGVKEALFDVARAIDAKRRKS
jgi:hypothetical protein